MENLLKSNISRLPIRLANHALWWKEIYELQHLYDVLKKYQYYKLLRSVHSKVKRLNSGFRKEVVYRVRGIIREFDVPTIIIIDAPYDWGLRNTNLQHTLLKTTRKMAYYENCIYIEKRASGKKCQLCSSVVREYKKTRYTRLYRCNRFNLIIDYNINACCRLCL
ncbi:MAG: hypothetical protein DRJ63_09505 [Thermoprotei archaeon]|nr:MAG: hypothetical protein DRJ63_09505 [Thermoprotei archaeon]